MIQRFGTHRTRRPKKARPVLSPPPQPIATQIRPRFNPGAGLHQVKLRRSRHTVPYHATALNQKVQASDTLARPGHRLMVALVALKTHGRPVRTVVMRRTSGAEHLPDAESRAARHGAFCSRRLDLTQIRFEVRVDQRKLRHDWHRKNAYQKKNAECINNSFILFVFRCSKKSPLQTSVINIFLGRYFLFAAYGMCEMIKIVM